MESKIIKILAIDDIQDNLITIQALVFDSFPNAIVITAQNGKDGLRLAAKEDPDVILLDIVMPEMDGFEVCRRLKDDKILRDIPVVFVTALKGDKGSRIKGLEVGAEAFLAKPIDESELIAQIRAMVKIKAANIQKRDENVRLTALIEERTRELKHTHTATLNLLEDLKKENEARRRTEEALRASEVKFREMTNLLPQIVFEIDTEGLVTYVNKRAQAMFNYEVSELIGKSAFIVLDSKDLNRSEDGFKSLILGENVENKEFILQRKDGSSFPALIYTSRIFKDDIVIGLRGMVIDITEQKQTEEKLTYLARLYSLLSQINQAVVRTSNLDELLQKICQVAIDYGQFRMAWIGISDENESDVIPIASAGYVDGYLDAISISRKVGPTSQGPISSAFNEGDIATCSDIRTDKRVLPWREEALKRGYLSLASVPLKLKDRIYGTLNLYTSENDFFSIDELRLLQEVGADISFAINAIHSDMQRKETAIALENSRIELKAIYDHAPVMMCVLDENRNVLFANQAFNALTSLEDSSGEVRKLGSLFHCLNATENSMGCGFGKQCASCGLRIALNDTFQTGKGHNNIDYQSHIVVGSETREISLLGSTAIIQTAGKNNILLCLHDISDRKQAEDALHKSEMLLRTFIDNTPFEIWARDINNVGILENKKFVDNYGTIIGYTPDTDPKVNSEIAKLWVKNNQRVFDGEIVDEEYKLVINNELRDYQQIVFPIVNNSNVIGIAGFNIDITDRKQADRKLLESEQRYRLLIETAMEAILVVQDHILKFSNHMLSEITGFSAEELMSRRFLEFVYPADRKMVEENYLKRINGEVISERDQFRMVGNDNSIKWVEMSGAKINWEDEPASINFLTDITERKINEEALHNSQKELVKFAAHLQNIREEERVLLAREIHDELGQILIAVKIDLGMLKQNVLKEIGATASNNVFSEFNDLSNLVDKTIHTTRRIMTDLRPEVLDLLGFSETVKQHLRAFEDRHKILCHLENNTKMLNLNSQQSVALFRIIQEALNNVAKHSKATEVRVNIIQKDNKLSLEVEDNGIGLNEKNKKNADSYGLIGMKERVFLLQGELTIVGIKDKGTTIRVEMPYNN